MSASATKGPGLAKKATSPVEVLAQSVANIAPSGVVATGAVLIYVNAGSGTWLSYVAATLIVLAVGYCLAQFARRSVSAGSVYTYTTKGLGPVAGFASGWGILIGYAFIAMGSIIGFGIFAGSAVSEVGLPGADTWMVLLLMAACVAGVMYSTIMGVRLSTRLSLVLEIASIGAILVVAVAAYAHYGLSLDTGQLSLDGASFDGIVLGVVLAILGFVGFESAASLGEEAKNPYRAIPRAILWSGAGAGLLYILGSYLQIKALGGGIVDSASPLNTIADEAGVGFLGVVIDIGVAASFFACACASVNAASRIVYAMGQEGVVSSMAATTSEEHKTPHVAIAVLSVGALIVPCAMTINGTDPIMILAYLGTIGTFGYMLSYGLVALAAPMWLKKIGEFSLLTAIIGPVVTLVMAYVFYRNVWPVAAYPFNVLPWIFAGMMTAGFAWYAVVRLRAPEAAARMGTYEETTVPEAV